MPLRLMIRPKMVENISSLVWIMSFVGDDLATGAVMSRLFAVGNSVV